MYVASALPIPREHNAREKGAGGVVLTRIMASGGHVGGYTHARDASSDRGSTAEFLILTRKPFGLFSFFVKVTL